MVISDFQIYILCMMICVCMCMCVSSFEIIYIYIYVFFYFRLFDIFIVDEIFLRSIFNITQLMK